MALLFFNRILKSVLQLFVVSIITFVLISLTPGDAATSLLGIYATPAAVAALQQQLQLDRPLWEQYANWLGRISHGDFGTSIMSGEPVTMQLAARTTPTLTLVIITLVVTAIVGIGLGVLSSLRGGWVARTVDALGLLGVGIPGFIIGLLLIVVFSSQLHWFPPSGWTPIGNGFWPWASRLVLPVTALVIGSVGFIAKQVRSAMVDALDAPFIRTLRGNGFTSSSIVFRHALRSATIPVLAVLGVAVVGLLGGSVLIEQVFGIPGLGGLSISAAVTKDLPVVQAVAVIYTIIIIVVNLLLDVIYVLVNPKVRIS